MVEINKVLIVEDDPNLGKILFEYLEAKNYNVSLAIDGEDGLDKFLKSKDWDIVLLDVMMPKKDGFSLARDIRKINKNIPIIFLTAKSQKDNIIKAFNLGADDYLTKPFSIEELIARIKAVIKRVPKKEENILPPTLEGQYIKFAFGKLIPIGVEGDASVFRYFQKI